MVLVSSQYILPARHHYFYQPHTHCDSNNILEKCTCIYVYMNLTNYYVNRINNQIVFVYKMMIS